MARKMNAHINNAIPANDDQRQPEAKAQLEQAFEAAEIPAEIEVYPGTVHGWCIPDMPAENGPVYDPTAAERAWSKLLALYQGAL